jgi:tripartite-type tricarboxylate transporter receptor subunit TctC
MMKKKFGVLVVIAMIFLTLAGGNVFAGGKGEKQTSPAAASDGAFRFTSPIQLIVATAPGALSDISCRLFAKSLSRTLGQNVVVVNIAGGGGSPAMHQVADAPADGYTLFYIEENNLTNSAIGACDMAWSDLDLVSLFGGTGTVCFFASAKTGVKSFADLKSYYEKNGPLSMAITYGAPSHFMTAAIEKASGIKLRNVDTNLGSDKILAIVSGQLQMTQSNWDLIAPYVEQGTINAIGNVGAKRNSFIPDIPTFNEQGCNIGDFYKFWGVAYRKGTDPNIIKTLNAHIKKTMEDPQTQADYKKLMYDTFYMDTQEAIAYVKSKEAFYNDIAQFIFSTQEKK